MTLNINKTPITSEWYEGLSAIDLETTYDHATIHMVGMVGPDQIASSATAEQLSKLGPVAAHNGCGFDFPVLSKVWGVQLQGPVIDTMLMYQILYPDHPRGHSLEALASLVGMTKMKSPDFDTYTEEMKEYCYNDTLICYKLALQGLSQLAAEGCPIGVLELENEVAQIIRGQERNGFRLDVPYAMRFKARLEDAMETIEKDVLQAFYPEISGIQGRSSKNLHEIMGVDEVAVIAAKYDIPVPYSKVNQWRVRPINLSSRQQLTARLMYAGWNPVKYTAKSIEKYKESGNKEDLTPILDEETLSGSPIPQAKVLTSRLRIEKILGYVTKWLELVSEEGRVHGRVFTIGAPTARMSHFSPNMAQIPATKTLYGKECRTCWIVDEGKVLTGVDASGLELRVLAHYVNDPEFTREIIEGDIHTKNQEAMQLASRDLAKVAIYAWLYGAGPAKLGAICGLDSVFGSKMKERLLKRWPAIRGLLEKVEKLSKKGWLPGIDGRRLKVRSAHSALNTLLQGCGAIVMKVALVICNRRLTEAGIDFKFVANVHDEFQIEHSPEDTELVQQIGKESIRDAGIVLNLRVPLAGEAKTGKNWAETH